MSQSNSNPAASNQPGLSPPPPGQPVSGEEAVTPKVASAREAAAGGVPAAGKRYTSDTIAVTFDGARCIHAAECVRGLPAVFDTKRRPWILPTAATAEEIVAVIERCPTGALHYERSGGPAEMPDARNTLSVQARGPYFTRGKLRVVTAQGELYLQDVRIALCRCGQSQYKPFCDNAHIAAGFDDPGAVTANADPADAETGTPDEATAEHGELSIKLRANGPLRLEGDFELISADRRSIYRGSATTLCRCGGSANKPFCDGSHRHNGFQG